MFKKAWSLLALAALGSMVFANVDLRTNIQDIYYRGTCEEAGAVTMSVNGNDFFEASTDTPVYIRVRLDKGGKLCDTLVDFQGIDTLGNAHTNVPVYLAMRVESSSGALIAAPSGTVSIIRWIEGESELWLRVQASSAQWLNVGGVTFPPDVNRRVAWTFGITARNSWNRNNPDFLVGQANLPANTNDLTAMADPLVDTRGWAISTLFCVDVSESILTPWPQLNSELNFDTISFDFQTTPPNTVEFASQISTGDQTTANFSGDDTIARGINVICSMTVDKGGQTSADLCLVPGGQNTQADGLVCMTDSIGINLFCDYGWNYFSQLIVVTPDGAPYGFPVIVDANGDPIIVAIVGGEEWWAVGVSGEVEGDDYFLAFTTAEYSFTAGGNILSAVAYLIWLGPDVQGPAVDIELTATVCAWYTIDPQHVDLQAIVYVTNHGDTDDEFPFDGTLDDGQGYRAVSADDQRQDCPPSYYLVGVVDWPFGTFNPCRSATVVIFFPYLPKLVDTPFWTGISFVNQGRVNFDDDEVSIRMYEADGSRWDASFPALPIRHQQTYLVADGDQGVGFYDDDNGIFIPVEAQNGDLVPLDKRSSAFIRGGHIGTSVLDISGPDLDGFCLIGNTVTQVVYGYLPRNTVPGATQVGDLPVQAGKTATFNPDVQNLVKKPNGRDLKKFR
jgi:hypothetical protein